MLCPSFALLALSSSALAGLLDGVLAPVEAALAPVLAPVTTAIATQPLLEALIHPRPGALIGLDILAGILAPADCGDHAVIGIQANITIGNLLDLCICIDIIGILDPDKTPCPACPVNSSPLCSSAACQCSCDAGFTKDADGDCVPPPGPSQASRNKQRRSRALADIRRSSLNQVPGSRGFHAARCPYEESACPVGLGGGYECLDTRTSLDSCGGCRFEGGVNCLEIEGVMGVGVVPPWVELLPG
ncbi:hypothetical protein RQP46_009233 [Phenoliferia psychrophenolica]